MLFISAIVSSGSRTLVSSRIKWPSTRITGGWPTAMCKSLALRLTTVCSSLSIRMLAIGYVFPARGAMRRSSRDERVPLPSDLFRSQPGLR